MMMNEMSTRPSFDQIVRVHVADDSIEPVEQTEDALHVVQRGTLDERLDV